MKKLIGRRRAAMVSAALVLLIASLPGSRLFSADSAAAAGEKTMLIDINTASVEELAQLPRIGEVVAKRIVAYREENGPFTSIEEIMGVQGIGEKVFERIKGSIMVKEMESKKKK